MGIPRNAGFFVGGRYNGDMKIAAAIVLTVALVFVATQLVSFIKEEHSLAGTYSDLEARLQSAKTEEQNLSAEVNYLANPANLEKELRARFNYAKPGETMIVIVPSSTPSSSSSSAGR